MSYATRAQLAEYLAVPESSLPQDADRLLERASEHIESLTGGPVTAEADLPYARRAVCAQVEFWLRAGEDGEFGGQVTSRTVGHLSETYAGASPRTAPRAAEALAAGGLLYSGVQVL